MALFATMLGLLLFSRAVFAFPILAIHNRLSKEPLTLREVVVAWCAPRPPARPPCPARPAIPLPLPPRTLLRSSSPPGAPRTRAPAPPCRAPLRRACPGACSQGAARRARRRSLHAPLEQRLGRLCCVTCAARRACVRRAPLQSFQAMSLLVGRAHAAGRRPCASLKKLLGRNCHGSCLRHKPEADPVS